MDNRINEECLNNAKKALEKVNKLDNRIIDVSSHIFDNCTKLELLHSVRKLVSEKSFEHFKVRVDALKPGSPAF